MLNLEVVEFLKDKLRRNGNSPEIIIEVCQQLKKALNGNLPDHMRSAIQSDFKRYQLQLQEKLQETVHPTPTTTLDHDALKKFQEKHPGIVMTSPPDTDWSDIIMPQKILDDIKGWLQSIL